MATYKQDLPPEGGYKNIQFKRLIRPYTSGWKVFGVVAGIHAVGYVHWTYAKEERTLEVTENFDSRLALLPFYQAEQDRYQLKKHRAFREFEEDLMKDVPGWKVGTCYGHKLYHHDAYHFNEQSKKEWHYLEKNTSFFEYLFKFYNSLFGSAK